MSTFVWHGGTSGDWGTGANWLVGGVEQAAAPTASDDVTFDDAAHTYSITRSAACACKTINTTGTTNAVTINISANNLTVSGSATFKSGDSLTAGALVLNATGTLTQSGATFANTITISGSGITVTLGSDIVVGTTKHIQLTQGTLDTSASNYAITCNYFYDNGSASTRGITLNSSTVTCSLLTFSGNAATLTVSASSATIVINSDIATANNFAGKAWGIVNFNSIATAARTHAITFGTGATFVQLNVDHKVDRRDTVLTLSAAFSVSDSCVWKSGGVGNDDPSYRLLIRSSAIGTQRVMTVTAASKTITLTDIDIQDFSISTTNSPTITSTRVGDCGGNGSGLCSTPKTVFMDSGTSSLYMYSNIWATSSGGGDISLNNIPLPQDTAVIDNNTWDLTGRSITTGGIRMPNIDASGLTESQNIYFAVGTYYGSLDLSGSGCLSLFTSDGVVLTIDARVAGTLNLNILDAIADVGGITIDSYGGTVVLGNNLTLQSASGSYGVFTLTRGTFDMNGKTLTCRSFSASNSNVRTLTDSGDGLIICDGVTGTIFTINNEANLTVSSSPNIQIGTGAQTLTGNVIADCGLSKTWGNITIKKHAGDYSITIQQAAGG